jgi:hypothetical protein
MSEGIMSERATELEWLQYFYQTADFGPAHEDVVSIIQDRFKEETGKDLPEGYEWDEYE